MGWARKLVGWLNWPNRRKQRPRWAEALLAVVHCCALGLLALVVAAAVVNHRVTPFYGWIRETPIERVGLYVIGVIGEQQLYWRNLLVDAPLLAEEAAARRQLIARIQRCRPTHAVVLADGTQLFGRLSESRPGAYRLETQAGDGRQQAMELPAADLRWHAEIEHAPVDLSPRDVRFLLNFPNFDYHFMPPYLIATDASYADILDAYQILSDLSGEFVTVFRHLLTEKQLGRLSYVCFFHDEESYLKLAVQKEDIDLEKSVGFYSQIEDCLYVYDRLQSFARRKVDRDIEKLVSVATVKYGQDFASRIRRRADAQKMLSHALLRRESSEALRHEAAHQLAYGVGVHSAKGFEHLWLPEGLAQYCETSPIGSLNRDKIRLLLEAMENGSLIPWHDLVDTPTPRGFTHYGPKIAAAYAQSWLLFYHLMQPRYRTRFMTYLDRVRNIGPADLARRRSEIVAECLRTPFLAIARDLNVFMEKQAGAQSTATATAPADPAP